MLSLTRIFLHNWHRFNHHVIEVEDSLYLAGHNGSGKSSVLDAIQLVLVADLQRVRFNYSAQSHERSTRSVDSYVRCKIGEDRWLRPGNTVAYIALEFTDKTRESKFTLGACIEAGEGRGSAGDRTFFILSEALDPELFIPDGRELPRRELKQLLKQRRGARSFDQVHEYQEEMLNRLGGLNRRFFELFLRALSFQPIRRIGEFVEKWLLAEEQLDVETLKQVVERLDQLRVSAREVEEKLAALAAITTQQTEVKRLRERYVEYIVLTVLLRAVALGRRVNSLTKQIRQSQQQISESQVELSSVQASLDGAQEALYQARVRFEQSDIVRRRDELRRRLSESERAANEITRRWMELLGALRREAEGLRPLLEAAVPPSLDQDETEGLRRLISGIAALSPDQPPPDDLTLIIDDVLPLLRTALDRAQEARIRIKQQSEDLLIRGGELEREIETLRGSRRSAYFPDNVERLRDLLTPELGARPPLLCELIEIPDERWQDAVEAMLGARRFTIIAPPEQFDAALGVLDQARERERIYEARLLDLGKASSESRPAQPNSLALQVKAQDRLVQSYIDTVLGDIITCHRVSELRSFRRAVTPDVVFYGEWAVRAINPNNFRPWFIGARAQRSQIEARERELRDIRDQLLALQPQSAALDARVASLRRVHTMDKLRLRFDDPLDARSHLELIEQCRTELQSLDLGGVEALEREVERLKQIVEREDAVKRGCIERLAKLEAQRQSLSAQKHSATIELGEAGQLADEARAAHPQAILPAEELLEERLRQSDPISDLSETIRNAESATRNFETRANNAMQELTRIATAYNTKYQFAGDAFDPTSNSYANEEHRLAATELPGYQQQIAEEQQRAEQQLREHVLHRLREKILQAKLELERINDALYGLEFHHKRYRFRYQPSEIFRPYYDLIMGAEMLGAQPLFESAFYQLHKGAFDDFYRQLTSSNGGDEREQLTDYRRYLSYDIEVIHSDGQRSSLSKIMGQTSGGETQTPFYLTIAASFLQLYRVGEGLSEGDGRKSLRPSVRPTIRLVAFDEAFSKMDQEHIGSTLELFQKFNLQIITATPLERCEYLVPMMCTSLVLTAVGRTVLIEPYRNYAARLQEEYAE